MITPSTSSYCCDGGIDYPATSERHDNMVSDAPTYSKEKPSDKTTAAACSRQTCEGCGVQGKLLCVYTAKDVMDFVAMAIGYLFPFVAGMIIGKFWIGLAVWFGLLLFSVYVEVLLFCRHCPHYAEKGFLLNCHANWAVPKIHKFDPRPMNTAERIIWLITVSVRLLYYIPFFVIGQQWLFLALTTSGLIAGSWTLQRTQCARCSHLSCPINRVPKDVRREFFENYPEFAEARKREGQCLS